MQYKFIITTLCICSTFSLYAEENSLGDILQEVGEKKPLVKPVPKKKIVKKRSRFTFVDRYDLNAIESKGTKEAKDKSESYEYENKERFKYKFNSGTGYNNISSGAGGSFSGGGGSAGGSGGSAGGGMSGGGHGRGGH